MSVEVTIKSGGLFKKQPQLSDIIFDGMRYGIIDEAYRLDEGKTGEHTVMFQSNHICRGFDVSLAKNEIKLIQPLPTSIKDIVFFYDYVAKLCQYMGTKYFIRNDEKTSLDKLEDCKRDDIFTSEGSLKSIEEQLFSGQSKSFYFFGAVNPLCVDAEQISRIHNDLNAFGEWAHSLQKLDVFYARAGIYAKPDNALLGIYTLIEDVPTVLPYVPAVLGQKLEINDWAVGIIIDGERKALLPYSEIIQKAVNKVPYDAEHFIIHLNKNELLNIIENNN